VPFVLIRESFDTHTQTLFSQDRWVTWSISTLAINKLKFIKFPHLVWITLNRVLQRHPWKVGDASKRRNVLKTVWRVWHGTVGKPIWPKSPFVIDYIAFRLRRLRLNPPINPWKRWICSDGLTTVQAYISRRMGQRLSVWSVTFFRNVINVWRPQSGLHCQTTV